MSDKLEKILEFFKSEKIELPIDVNNAIEDVFNENDTINNVDIYFREDANVFESDLLLENRVDAHLNKPSSGSVNAVFTYYGDIEYSLSEFVTLYNDENEVEEQITSIDNRDSHSRLDPDRYAVVLLEKITWENGKIERTPNLFIYCPEGGEVE